MVRLNRIYTRAGDTGTTGLGNGQRIAKTSLRVEAMGVVDELNAGMGLLDAALPPGSDKDTVRSIMNDLFDAGADLCLPGEAGLRISDAHIARLEAISDAYNGNLQELTSFILPGGSETAARCHMARVLCRRAERALWRLHAEEPLSSALLAYMNRLSDFLFILARHLNDDGRTDTLWKPGASLA